MLHNAYATEFVVVVWPSSHRHVLFLPKKQETF